MKLKFVHLINLLKHYKKDIDESDVIKITLFVKNSTFSIKEIDAFVENYVMTKRANKHQETKVELDIFESLGKTH